MRREDVFARDGYQSVYCGQRYLAEELTVDHVQPRVRGGDNSAGNVVTACGGCNVLKGHRRLSEYLAADPQARRNFFRLAARSVTGRSSESRKYFLAAPNIIRRGLRGSGIAT